MSSAAVLPGAALSRLPGDPVPAPLGHNGGPPLDGNRSWRVHCWRKARRDLIGRHIPVEIVRRRVVRAKELGLAYPAYAAILMGSGRDITAFLFTAEAIGLRLERAARAGALHPQLDAAAATKLATAPKALRGLMAPAAAPEALAEALRARGAAFTIIADAPDAGASDAEGRAAIRALLAPLRLPGDAVVMVGARADERRWAEAARLARFIAAPVYFAAPEAGGVPA